MYLKKDELEIGAEYECRARNFTVGKWNGKAFEYERTKFTMKFQDQEYHWDDGAPFGTVKPIRKIT